MPMIEVELDTALVDAAMRKQPDITPESLRQALEAEAVRVAAAPESAGLTPAEIGRQAVHIVEATLAEIVHADAPWTRDAAMRDALEEAGWRYATLIGIIDPPDEGESGISQAVRAADRAEFGAMVRSAAGPEGQPWPVWDDADAIAFVQAKTGCTADVCRAWLDYDWHH